MKICNYMKKKSYCYIKKKGNYMTYQKKKKKKFI